MEKFNNRTKDGNEKALRRGRTVPDGDLGLAFYKSDTLTPQENMIVIDTSNTGQLDRGMIFDEPRVYYANAVGVLEDINGNQLIPDQYPIISDVFNAEEDFSLVPNISEYRPEHILAFKHTSRFFHLDYAHLTPGTETREIETTKIKVSFEDGREYVDAEGKPRYKVMVCPASSRFQVEHGNQWAYRVFVYTDSDDNNELYVSYNKVEVDNAGRFFNWQLGYRERLNPVPFFDFQPEEAAVADPQNKKKKWYSTKLSSTKSKLLGQPSPLTDGYRVYVPKKAIADPRLFQLFRWRVNCNFRKRYTLDESTATQVRVGVVTTTHGANRKSRTPYLFYNLEKSAYNIGNISFVNPLKEGTGISRKSAEYWEVNLGAISEENLAKFDILVWSPMSADFDITPFLDKIRHFTRNLGRTFFLDTNNWSRPTGAWSFGAAFDPQTGAPRTEGDAWKGAISSWDLKRRERSQGPKDTAKRDGPFVKFEVWDGLESLSGWYIDEEKGDSELESLSFLRWMRKEGTVQCIKEVPDAFYSLISGKAKDGTVEKDVSYFMWRPVGKKGNLFVSTIGILASCNMLFDYRHGEKIKGKNNGPQIFSVNDTKYTEYINTPITEGAMKTLYNVVLMALRRRRLTGGEGDDEVFTTEWTHSSEWKSSWVISAGDGVLTQDEIERYQFVYRETDEATPSLVWQRRLDSRTIKQIIESDMTPEMLRKVEGTTREYEIEVTNSVDAGGAVEVPLDPAGTVVPHAWTTAYTPRFVLPMDLGHHIIKEEMISGEYESATFTAKTYPRKPFKCQLRASVLQTNDGFDPTNLSWIARGKAIETYTIPAEPDESVRHKEIKRIPWNMETFEFSISKPYTGLVVPRGLGYLQELQYETSVGGAPNQNWPYFGISGRFGLDENTGYGSGDSFAEKRESGDIVTWIQHVLNSLRHEGIITLPRNADLRLDGIYGPKVAEAIESFQEQVGARYVDGICDSETLSFLGVQALRLKDTLESNPNNFTRYYQWAWNRLPKTNISDLDRSYSRSGFSKQSPSKNGPNYIWESFFLQLDKPYDIVGIEFIPFSGQANRLFIEGIDVRRNLSRFDLERYDPKESRVRGRWKVRTEELARMPIGPFEGRWVILTLGQNRPAFDGSNTARVVGLRDFCALASVWTSTTIPGNSEAVEATREVEISTSGTLSLDWEGRRSFKARLRNETRRLSNIQWESITLSSKNPEVSASIVADGTITIRTKGITEGEELTDRQANVTGPMIGDQNINSATYYSKTTQNRRSMMRELGDISKEDGIKLICKANGKPYGFDSIDDLSLMPDRAVGNDVQRHFVSLRLESFDTDPVVRLGFYDLRRQEFITNVKGEPEMTWIEYCRRGPANVFIAARTDHEISRREPIPDDDATLLPQRWAMPAYGVLARGGSEIKLMPAMGALTEDDLWPVSVKVGSITKKMRVRPLTQGPLTGWLRRFQGTDIEAFYSVPEAERGGFSTLHGPPYHDVRDETPVIEDSLTIRVRKAPILMVQEPTLWNLDSDPVRPVFKVYKRETVNSEWVELTLTEIKDWDLRSGRIFLRTALTSTDENLLKVEYTSAMRVHQFKGTYANQLNLNPYTINQNLFGRAIYIYIVPLYVRDRNGNSIPESISDKSLFFTHDPSIFNPIKPEYNPLAIQLGIVYITNSVDIEELTLLDIRRRGGGLADSIPVSEISRLISEFQYYWDTDPAKGTTYRNTGFVIIRLPAALRDFMSFEDVYAIIRKNITTSVAFEVQDLDGTPWRPE